VVGLCGLWWGEAIALTTDDVDLLRGRIIISKNAVWLDGRVHLGMPKSNVERSVPLIGVVAEKLEVHMRGVELGGLVWTASRGGYVPRLNARDGWWGMALGESGIPRVTSYELCHAAVSLAV